MLYSFTLVLDTNRLLNTLADFEERDSSPIYAHRCAERVFALLIELSRSSQKAYNAISRCRVTGVVCRTMRVDDSVTQKQNVWLCILFVSPLLNIQLARKISALSFYLTTLL
jgi:hypothetical protein